MKILVDADACPVVKIAEKVAKEKDISLVLICDTSHVMSSDYAQVIIVDKGADSADFALIGKSARGDIVVTQDYGVAAMALGKGVYVMHQSGKEYTNENIDQMLFERHMSKKARRSSSKFHGKGPRKRTEEDDIRFEEAFRRLVERAIAKE
ncbi:YaiI/YqxD family protein [uncultured Robinsoniella sp.]|uniref:YaiI/YqxD family protein n=1 Tax=uncultured Robinsoniella sp. TaxID=904190 RepID=UPI00374F202D